MALLSQLGLIASSPHQNAWNPSISTWSLRDDELTGDNINESLPLLPTIGLLQIKDLSITVPQNMTFLERKNTVKYFEEQPKHPHLDSEYGVGTLSKDDIHQTLRFLFEQFTTVFLEEFRVNLSSEYPLYWLEYGSLLGSFREQNIIRWDDDGDIGIFDFILAQFPMRYESEEWLFRRNPDVDSLIYDGHNTVSARFISKENGVFIDIFATSIIEDVISGGKYSYNSWSIKDFNFWQKLDDLLPIDKEALFLKNETFNAPRNTERWLLKEYKTLDAPSDKLFIYDENYILNDSYWYFEYDTFYHQHPSYPI